MDELMGNDSVPVDVAAVNAVSGGDAVSDEMVAEGGLDLTPRVAAAGARSSRKRWPMVAGGAVVAALVAVVFVGLNEATVYFKYVDEAVAQRSELGTDFFRMQGNIVPGSVEQTADGAAFTLRRHGSTARVVHTGAEPALFGDPKIPVVVEGHWQGDAFQSQRIIVNHDAAYEEANPDRIEAATSEAEVEAGDGNTGADSTTTAPAP